MVLALMLMCVSVLTGCSLVGRNDKKYYEAVVCVISYQDGTSENITKRDLINAYNSYGYNYVENYGYEMKKAIETTLNTIVDNRLTVRAVEEHYRNNPSEGKMLNDKETTYLWDKTYDAMYSNLRTYFNEITENSEYGEETEEEKSASVYAPYERTAYLEKKDGSYIIKKTVPATTIRESYEARQVAGNYVDFELKVDGEYVFKDAMYDQLQNLTKVANKQSATSWKETFNKYYEVIKNNYSYMDFEDDKECFIFEMNRVYKIIKDNYIVEKYGVIYNREKHEGADVANVTVKNVLEHYSSKVRADYVKYGVENNTAYSTDLLDNVGDMDYIKDDANYFYVASIKMDFDEDQKAKYDMYKAAKENRSITVEQYNKFVKELYQSVYATERDAQTGEKIANKTISAQNLLTKIKDDIASAGGYDDGETADYNKAVSYRKADAFRKYLYLFNDDDSLKGATYNTVFGVDANNEVVLKDDYDKESIKTAIKALYNEGNAKVGDVSGLVETEDGIYIFFFAGKVENLFGGIDENFDISRQSSSVEKLASTRLNIFSEKTVFDAIYEELTTDNFATFENMNMSYLRGSLVKEEGIVYIENNIKDMYE